MKKTALIIIIFVLFVPFFSYAQSTGNTGTPGESTGNTGKPTQNIPTLQNPIKANNVEELLYNVIDVAIFIGVIIAVLMFVFVGFTFVMAQGNPEKIKAAKNWFLWLVVGTAVLVSSKVIVEVFKNTAIQAGFVKEDAFNKPK